MPFIDRLSQHADLPHYSARSLLAITPSDTDEVSIIPKALFIGGSGTISIIALDDTAPVSLTVTAGQILPIRAKFVRATGTTATGIVGLL